MTDTERPNERGDPDVAPSRKRGQPFRLLFVCTGNTCRSPMARSLTERASESRGWGQLEVRSAGVAAWPGAPASEGARRAAERHGLDLERHRSAQLTPELVQWADLVLTMSPGHVASAEAMGGAGKTSVITRFATEGDAGPEGAVADGVRDPMGGHDREYEATFHELRDLVDRVLGRLAPLVSP